MDDNTTAINSSFEETSHRWKRREAKKKREKNFSSDNRKSVRWLQENSMKKAEKAQEFLEGLEEE